MTSFAVIPAKPWHCGQMARHLRRSHRVALAPFGIGIHRELAATFEASAIRIAGLLDGRLAALGGVTGTLLDPHGFTWLALTEEATRHPVTITRAARRVLANIMDIKRELSVSLLDADEAAKRFAIFLGFHAADDGAGATATRRRARVALLRHLDVSDRRIAHGGGHVIMLGYHEAA
jgi:hypothetical protein